MTSPAGRLWACTYRNAKNRGIPHTIKVDDIPLPATCRYFAVPVDYNHISIRGSVRAPFAASVDRIIPALGYVPGNIQVISDLANRMKSNATIAQLLAFAKGVLREHR